MAPVKGLDDLDALVQTAVSLLQQLQAVLSEIHKTPTSPTASPELSAFNLARDSSSLIRAHSTKISLLIINEPFSPTALIAVLRELIGGPIPGLASAVQACDPSQYTAVLRKELAWRARRVLAELAQLLARIPKDGKALNGSKKDGGSGAGKGSIASTGVLWAACDDVVKLVDMGVGGFFVKKVDEWRDTLKDVMEEMKEWGDEEPDDDDEDEDEENEDVGELTEQMDSSHLSTQAILDDLMSSQRTISATDPDRIRPRLDSSLKRLRLVLILFQAITKRRLKRLPSLPPQDSTSTVPQRLDEVAVVLQRLPDRFGDLAGAFYELRPDAIDRAMDDCFLDAFAASEMLRETWDGERDDFSSWTIKFQAEIKKD